MDMVVVLIKYMKLKGCVLQSTQCLLFVFLKRMSMNFRNMFFFYMSYLLNDVKEYRKGNRKWTILRNWQHLVHKTKTSVGHHYAKTNTYNVKQSKFMGKYIISKLHLKFTFPNFNNVPVILR